ncbi:MAG: bifunctional 3-phenylpropionate/cinnamic acid dioxygenase ferredoxin subunit [Marinosulfonomonas sp.]|nr:bifunctional 3-phenylpropionate/cinnamic acid dioxygenase ferredoxin subunit [Marinosulfonomonas sp.]
MLKVCQVDDVEPGDTLQLICKDRPPIALYNVDGTFFATDDICSHGDASLADGLLEDFAIECPFHAGTFDVRTGEALTRPCVHKINTYPVKIEDGFVYVLANETAPA